MNSELLAKAYATNPTLPKAGDIIWNQGHEFIVTDPQVHPVPESSGPGFTHQFTYAGKCTDNECNDSIRHTHYNGGTYGWGINL